MSKGRGKTAPPPPPKFADEVDGVKQEEEEIDSDSLEALFDACDDEYNRRKEKKQEKKRKRERMTPEELEAERERRKVRDEKRARKRARALARARKSTHVVKNREKCDCYTDKSVVRAQLHLKTVEQHLTRLRAATGMDVSTTKQYEKRLIQCEKYLDDLKSWLMSLKRTADNAQARASRQLEAFAVVTQPLLEINTARKDGAPLKITHYDRWSFLEAKPRPKTRT